MSMLSEAIVNEIDDFNNYHDSACSDCSLQELVRKAVEECLRDRDIIEGSNGYYSKWALKKKNQGASHE